MLFWVFYIFIKPLVLWLKIQWNSVFFEPPRNGKLAREIGSGFARRPYGMVHSYAKRCSCHATWPPCKTWVTEWSKFKVKNFCFELSRDSRNRGSQKLRFHCKLLQIETKWALLVIQNIKNSILTLLWCCNVVFLFFRAGDECRVPDAIQVDWRATGGILLV